MTYRNLFDILSTVIPSFSDDIIKQIITYLCYQHFYFGNACSLNIKTGTVAFNVFDVNQRLCFIITTQIINYRQINNHTHNIITNNDEKVINMHFEGDYLSCNTQHKSQFCLQYKNIYLIMKWIKINNNIPSIYYISTYTNNNNCKPLKLWALHKTIFILTKQPIEYINNNHKLQLIQIHQDNNLSFNARLNGYKFTHLPVSIAFKKDICNLFSLQNNTFRTRMAWFDVDYFILNVCLWRNPYPQYIGQKYDAYIDVSGICSHSNSLRSIAKFSLFKEELENDYKIRRKIIVLKIIPPYFINPAMNYSILFVVYTQKSGWNEYVVCVGYFDLRNYYDSAQNEGEMGSLSLFKQFLPTKIKHCILSNERILCRFANVDLISDLVGNTKIHFKMVGNTKINHYILNSQLDILSNWTVDIWHGYEFNNFHCMYLLDKINIINNWKKESNFVVMKSNDLRLQKKMKYTDRKNGIIGIGLLFGFTYTLVWIGDKIKS
eukprot:128338_1